MAERGNSTQMLIEALTANVQATASLAQQLTRQSEFERKQGTILRDEQPVPSWEQGRIFDPDTKLSRAQRRRQRAGQEALFDSEVGSGTTIFGSAVAPDSDERTSATDWQKFTDARNRARRGGTGRLRSALAGFTQFAPPSQGTAVPLNSNQTGDSMAGSFLDPTRTDRMHAENEQALTWSIMGEHGGPQAIRNMYLEKYGLKRSLQWGSSMANSLGNSMATDETGKIVNPMGRVLSKLPGMDAQTIQGLSGMLSKAAESDYAYPLYKTLQLGHRGLRAMGQNFRADEELGWQLGYGPTAAFGQSIFGIRNPLGDFSTAARTGAAYNQLNQAMEGKIPGMGFGSGLNAQQAQSVSSTLVGQGFGLQPLSPIASTLGSIPGIGGLLSGIFASVFGGPRGDAQMIGQNFMEPLMQRFPGLTGEDLGQFTGSLRYGGTSIQQLTDSLDSLGVEARAAKMPIGEFTSAVAQVGQVAGQLGSSTQGGQAIGQAETRVTGLPPEVAGQLMNNPMFQGLALSRYGVLPSGLGQMNPGSFVNTQLSMVQMLQHATQGFNRNIYRDGVLVESGQQAQIAQIAQMSGIPYNMVKQMLRDMPHAKARANLQQVLGDATTGTGLWGEAMAGHSGSHHNQLNKRQYAATESQWKALTKSQDFRAAGLSKKQVHDLDTTSGMRDRLTKLAGFLGNAAKDDKTNQLADTPNSNTITLQLNGQAANLLKFSNGQTSISKKVANAGVGPSYNATTTSNLGDVGQSWQSQWQSGQH